MTVKRPNYIPSVMSEHIAHLRHVLLSTASDISFSFAAESDVYLCDCADTWIRLDPGRTARGELTLVWQLYPTAPQSAKKDAGKTSLPLAPESLRYPDRALREAIRQTRGKMQGNRHRTCMLSPVLLADLTKVTLRTEAYAWPVRQALAELEQFKVHSRAMARAGAKADAAIREFRLTVDDDEGWAE